MSCDRRCFDPESKWFDHEDCSTCPGRDSGPRTTLAYQFSTDYEALYRMICDELTIVGFVDYRFDKSNHDEPPMRDVVQIRREREFEIHICARGISYGDIYPFMRKYGPEREVFLGVCQSINLAFVHPQATA